MNHRRTYDLAEVNADDYPTLLQALAPIATMFGLIIESPLVRLTERAKQTLTRLEPFLLNAEQVQSWPGTQVAGDETSLRNLYRLEPASVHVLQEAATSFWDWVNPDLPEDLHLLRADGSTVLGTIAQEDDAWVELSDAEVAQVSHALSSKLQGVFQHR